MSKKPVAKQVPRSTPRYQSFGKVAKNPEQRCVFNHRVEQVVRAFLAGRIAQKLTTTSVPAMLLGERTEVHIGKMNTCEGDIHIAGDVVTACALLGVSARKIMDKLICISVEHDDVKYPAVSIDNSKIISDMTAPLGAVYYAVEQTLKRA